MFMRTVVWSTVSESGLQKKNKHWFPYSRCFSLYFMSKCSFLKTIQKVQLKCSSFLSCYPSFFLHPTALPLHPHTASHSALILLFSRCLSSLTRVNGCCSPLLFPQPCVCMCPNVCISACDYLWLYVHVFVCDPVMMSWIRNGHSWIFHWRSTYGHCYCMWAVWVEIVTYLCVSLFY